MTTLLEQFKQVAQKNNEQIEKLRKESAALVKPLLQQFLKDYPQVKQIKWTHYSPYFNDGEACVFSLHTFGFYFDGDDLEESLYESELPHKYDSEWWQKQNVCSIETYKACGELESQLRSIEDELEALFGDHVEVTVTADGVEVEEYDHD